MRQEPFRLPRLSANAIRFWATFLVVACLGGVCARAAEAILFAMPATNGVWLGKSPAPAPGEAGKMLTNWSAVLAEARAARGQLPPNSTVTIQVRGGRYALTEPLQLHSEDSGLSLVAYQDEVPIFSGGRRITGWRVTPGKPGWWETEIPAVRQGKFNFRSLFVNGRRAQRARTPNEGFLRIDGDSPQQHPAALHFHPGDIQPQWAAAGDVEVVALLAWSDFRMFIRGIDETQHIATLSTNPHSSNREKDARYYIENAADALDAPGEWYLDRPTGMLRYIARNGEFPDRCEVIAPVLAELVVLQGDFAAQKPVTHVTLRGLTFSHSDWTQPAEGYADPQAAVAIHGDLRAEAATDCVIENCSFTHLAGYGIELGRGCQRDRISGCELSDLGAGGIRVGEQGPRTIPFELNHSHTITDNHIHDAGCVYAAGVGIFILQSGTNRVAHNEVDHMFYTGVSVGWNWGYQETPCRENIVEYNHLHDIGQAMLSDMGAVYTLGIQHATIIRNNLIHDVDSFTYGGWGLYPDEGSTGILWENNVVYHCKSAGFHQHYGRENVVRNNIFAFNREHELMRTRNEEHTSFFFTNNIVLFDQGQLLGSNWEGNHFVIDRNIYWDLRTATEPGQLRFAGATLAQWQTRGHDVHSLITDPQFIAPRQFDFRLQPGSPALGLGFHPIDLISVGVRKVIPAGKR